MEQENGGFLDSVRGWLSRPFTDPMSPMFFLILGGIFLFLLWLVIDRQQVLEKARTIIEVPAA